MCVIKKLALLAVSLLLSIHMAWPQQQCAQADLASLRDQMEKSMQLVQCDAKQQVVNACTNMLINNLPFSSVEEAQKQALAQYPDALNAMQAMWNKLKDMKSCLATCFAGRVQNQTAQQIVQQFASSDFTSMTPRDMCTQGVNLHHQLSAEDNKNLHACRDQQIGTGMDPFGMFKHGQAGANGGAAAFGNQNNPMGNGGGMMMAPPAMGAAGQQQQQQAAAAAATTPGDACDMMMSYAKQAAQEAHAVPCGANNGAQAPAAVAPTGRK
ncbi:hypothetical protein niasHT_029419 [Heterodera trifolii]|uniref:Uncharacterized protein n=1 Tax=Heterodera trifolii TaxID=157864 RepID=A0ABD2KQB7_9BILA